MSFSIDMAQIFGYAEDIVNALMVVVYVAGGIGLGFKIISMIKSLFG